MDRIAEALLMLGERFVKVLERYADQSDRALVILERMEALATKQLEADRPS